MICDTIGLTADIYASMYVHGGSEVEEVYGGLNYADPIFYKMQTITGTASIAFDSYPGHLTDYTILGNSYQDGTPSPDDPVEVVGCGVRTENLFDTTSETNGEYYREDGAIGYSVSYSRTDYIPVVGGETYTISAVSNQESSAFHCFYDSEKRLASTIRCQSSEACLTVPSTASFARFSYRKASNPNIMLNLGSTPLPYEPYGYKIPVTVNGTEYPIYLGQVPTTRRIKKLVLDGTEKWRALPSPNHTYATTITPFLINDLAISSHFMLRLTLQTVVDKTFMLAYGREIYIKYNDTDSVNDFKAYLAAQYAAGTPVTVWYVLAEPETGIVNEPLMKIGDYADTISMAQASVTIPTTAGTNTLTVGTTVQPSAVSITGNIKPTGYGQLLDVNGVDIQDSNGTPIFIQG